MVAKDTTGPFKTHDTIHHARGPGTSDHGGNDWAGSANSEAYHCPSYVRAFLAMLLRGGDTKTS